jgi:hypothetical protein
MSAVGQKRTWRQIRVISALPPKADIGQPHWDVRLVPKAAIAASFDHLVGALLQQLGANIIAVIPFKSYAH